MWLSRLYAKSSKLKFEFTKQDLTSLFTKNTVCLIVSCCQIHRVLDMASTIAKNTVSNRDHVVKSGLRVAVETSSSLNSCHNAARWVAAGVDHH